MHEVLVNRLGGLSLPRKSVVRLTDRPDMTLDVYRGRKTTMQQCNNHLSRSGIKRLLGTINQHLCVVDNFEKSVYSYNQLPFTSSQAEQIKLVNMGGISDIGKYAQNEHRHGSINHSSRNGQHERPAFTEIRYGRHGQPQQQTGITQLERCMKCGLSNHTTFECKHQKQVRCFKCHCYGHKDSSGLCWDIK